eukprot:2891345-Rhodomonas_salina.1
MGGREKVWLACAERASVTGGGLGRADGGAARCDVAPLHLLPRGDGRRHGQGASIYARSPAQNGCSAAENGCAFAVFAQGSAMCLGCRCAVGSACSGVQRCAGSWTDTKSAVGRERGG